MCLNHNNALAYDDSRAEGFADRLVGMLNEGAIALMTSIGHRTGLFDVMADLPPSASEEIAAKAELNERYVREWLGSMVTGKIIEVDPETRQYHLPREHAAFLTRGASSDNIAVFAQYISVLGGVEDDIVACFKEGGGVPYEKYTRFHEVMAEDSGQSVLSSLFDHILPLMPGLKEKLQAGIKVLDLGCGRGHAMLMLAEHFPDSQFIGYDLSTEAINYARSVAQQKNLKNINFVSQDLSDFDIIANAEEFDLITTFDAVHDQAKPLSVLKGINKALKQNGVYLMQDIKGSSHVHNNIEHPIGSLLYTISCMHCMSVSLAQGGEGLGAMWGEEKAQELLYEAGFSSVDIKTLEHDFQNNYYIARKQ